MKIARACTLMVCTFAMCSIAFLASNTAQAASITYTLDKSNVTGAFPDGAAYLQVTLTDISGDRTELTVETLDALNSIAGSNFGIQRFSFNLSGLTLDDSTVASLPDRWRISGPRQHSGFGNFDVTLQGDGRSRTDLLTVILNGSVTDFNALSGGNAGLGNSVFAAHVAGFDANGKPGSAQFGGSAPPVPLPASIWLFLSGLGLLGFFKSRQRKTKIKTTPAIQLGMARRFSLQHYAIARIAH